MDRGYRGCSGMIQGIGPRYCPSIEDKIHRLPQAKSPDFSGARRLTTNEFYPNGSRRAFPSMCRSSWCAAFGARAGPPPAAGLMPSNTTIYDPRNLRSSLKRNRFRPVFRGADQRHHRLRGAAAQGILAGINAALFVRDEHACARGGRRICRVCRRPHHPRCLGGVPHVHQPRGIPAMLARGRTMPTCDSQRLVAGPRSGRRRWDAFIASATRSA